MVSNLEHPFGTYRDVRNAELIGRLRFTANGKCEFVPDDQVCRLISVYCLLLLLKNKQFHASFIRKNCSGQFYLLIF